MPDEQVRLELAGVDDFLFSYQPMEFQVGLGFPELAKIGVVVFLILVAGLIALIWFIIYRIRRRKASQIST